MQELVVAQATAAPAAPGVNSSVAAGAANPKASEGLAAQPRSRARGPQESVDFGLLLAALCLGGQAPAGGATEVAAPAAGVSVSGGAGTTAIGLTAEACLLANTGGVAPGGLAQRGEGVPTRLANAEAVALIVPLAGEEAVDTAVAAADDAAELAAAVPAVKAAGASGAMPAAGVPEEGLSGGAREMVAPEQGEPVAGQGKSGKAELTALPAGGRQGGRLPVAELVARPPADSGAAPGAKGHGPQGRLEHDAGVMAATRQVAGPELGLEAPDFAGAAARELSPGNLAREIVSQGLAVWQRGYGYVRLKLEPEFLGHLDLRVTSHLGRLSAHLVVENEAVRSLVQACLPLLEQNLVQHGLSLASFQVDVGGSGAGRTAGGFGRPPGGYDSPSSGGRAGSWADHERPGGGFFLINYLA